MRRVTKDTARCVRAFFLIFGKDLQFQGQTMLTGFLGKSQAAFLDGDGTILGGWGTEGARSESRELYTSRACALRVECVLDDGNADDFGPIGSGLVVVAHVDALTGLECTHS